MDLNIDSLFTPSLYIFSPVEKVICECVSHLVSPPVLVS